MSDLKNSDYNEKDREVILIGGIKTFSKLKDKEIMGQRPFYRPPDFRKDERIASKIRKSKDWYKCGKSDNEFMSVMFVEATPEDRLLKMLKETEDKYRISEKHRIKFVTKSGIRLKHLLERKDQFLSKCMESDCYPCAN